MAQKPSIPKGTRDFGPAEMAGRNYIFDTIRSVFKTYGYAPIETPSMENLSTLLGKYGEEGDKLLFRILNSGDAFSKINYDEYRVEGTQDGYNSKALSLDTEIPTPNGWIKLEDIHSGDFVYGTDGKPHMVIGESEVFHKPMYLMTFEDGAEIVASGDHIWTVQTKDSRRTSRRQTKRRPNKPELRANNGWYDITTAEMLDDFKKDRRDGKGTEYKYRVPMSKPVEYPILFTLSGIATLLSAEH